MRFKLTISLLVVLLAVSFMASFSLAQKDDTTKKETIGCPVSGEKVLKSEAVGPYAYNGKEYYFCCNNCLEKFKKDPETYLNKTKDFVCGMSIDKRTAKKASLEGTDYYFCSDNCKAAFEKDPKAYIMKAMKTSHEHGKGEGCEGCTGDKAVKTDAGKECCSDKVKKECCGDKVKKDPKNKI